MRPAKPSAINRRTVLKTGLGAAGLALWPFGRAAAALPAFPEGVIFRPIPATGETLPISGLNRRFAMG